MAKKTSGSDPTPANAPQAADQAKASDTHDREREQGGGGNIDAAAAEAIIAAGKSASAEQLDRVGDFLKGEQDKFRAACPKLSAAIDAWQAKGGPAPTAVRIVSRVDGFRRADIAHSRDAVEHPLESFRAPEQLEALLAEPNLVVEFV